MATLRLATSPGVRAATTSPLTSQLWSSAAAVNSSSPSIPSTASTIPAAKVAAAAIAAATTTTTTTKTIIPPPPSVLARARTKAVEPQNRYFNPSNATLSTTGGGPSKKPGAENNANLGKSTSFLTYVTVPGTFCATRGLTASQLKQPFASSKTTYLGSSSPLSRKRSSLPTSRSTSSRQHTRTSRPSPAASPTPLPSGPRPSPGTACRWSGTSAYPSSRSG